MPREVSVRELRNHTGEVIAAVKAGERVTLTVNRQAVADIVPHQARRRVIPGRELVELLRDDRADVGLREDLDRALPDTTDDLWPSGRS
jgi:prevent-host-death family protein